jgi:hypothetical protein
MNDAKYIGYVALDIADTMWPSRLCRVAAWLPVCITSQEDDQQREDHRKIAGTDTQGCSQDILPRPP